MYSSLEARVVFQGLNLIRGSVSVYGGSRKRLINRDGKSISNQIPACEMVYINNGFKFGNRMLQLSDKIVTEI